MAYYIAMLRGTGTKEDGIKLYHYGKAVDHEMFWWSLDGVILKRYAYIKAAIKKARSTVQFQAGEAVFVYTTMRENNIYKCYDLGGDYIGAFLDMEFGVPTWDAEFEAWWFKHRRPGI